MQPADSARGRGILNRDYEPAIGRYLQADLIGQQRGIGLHQYVDNSPLFNVDAPGLFKGKSCGGLF